MTSGLAALWTSSTRAFGRCAGSVPAPQILRGSASLALLSQARQSFARGLSRQSPCEELLQRPLRSNRKRVRTHAPESPPRIVQELRSLSLWYRFEWRQTMKFCSRASAPPTKYPVELRGMNDAALGFVNSNGSTWITMVGIDVPFNSSGAGRPCYRSSSLCCLSNSSSASISGCRFPATIWSRLKFFSPPPSPPRRWSVQRFWGKL